MKGARYALKNPEDPTDRQHDKLTWIAANDPALHRAYQLKEGLRLIFRMPLGEATQALDRWIGWARQTVPPPPLREAPTQHRDLQGIDPGLDRARPVQRTDRVGQHQDRLITRIAFDFASPHALIALSMLSLGGHRPVLPGRK